MIYLESTEGFARKSGKCADSDCVLTEFDIDPFARECECDGVCDPTHCARFIETCSECDKDFEIRGWINLDGGEVYCRSCVKVLVPREERPAFAGGGYPIVYHRSTRNGVKIYCAECSRRHVGIVDSWTHDEGGAYVCSECDHGIYSSYGDPECGCHACPTHRASQGTKDDNCPECAEDLSPNGCELCAGPCKCERCVKGRDAK